MQIVIMSLYIKLMHLNRFQGTTLFRLFCSPVHVVNSSLFHQKLKQSAIKHLFNHKFISCIILIYIYQIFILGTIVNLLYF